MADIEADTLPEVQIDAGAEKPDGTLVVALSGELDSSNIESLEPIVASLRAQPPARLVFDLARLRFLDSAGIAVLLTVAKICPVHVHNPSAIVRRVLEATGLSDVLHLER